MPAGGIVARGVRGAHLDRRQAHRRAALHALRGGRLWRRQRCPRRARRSDGSGQLLVRRRAPNHRRQTRSRCRCDDRKHPRRGRKLPYPTTIVPGRVRTAIRSRPMSRRQVPELGLKLRPMPSARISCRTAPCLHGHRAAPATSSRSTVLSAFSSPPARASSSMSSASTSESTPPRRR